MAPEFLAATQTTRRDLQMIGNGSHLLIFPTVASQGPDPGSWLAEIHGWCFDVDEERHFRRTTANLLRRALRIPRGEPDPPFFRERACGFVVENLGKVSVEISFEGIPAGTVRTKRNGHYRNTLSFVMSGNGSPQTTSHGSRKVSVQARRLDSGLGASGVIHLPEDRGLSIISDIDDTIKFSNVINKRELLVNTFLRNFRCIEGMPGLFQRLARDQICFHYISATPWQLYPSIVRFLSEHQFPEGSIHLRKFALKDATILKKIFPAHKKKRKVIESLLLQFPERKFLLFGDTGEKDPEIYGEIARKYPDQTLGLCLRNVSPDAPDSPRFRRAFSQVPSQKWIVFEDARRLEEDFLPELLKDYPGKTAEEPGGPLLLPRSAESRNFPSDVN